MMKKKYYLDYIKVMMTIPILLSEPRKSKRLSRHCLFVVNLLYCEYTSNFFSSVFNFEQINLNRECLYMFSEKVSLLFENVLYRY